MTKKIWYISHYIAPPEYDTHSRAMKFSEYLLNYGYDVTIFCSSYLHNKHIDLIKDNSKYIEKKYGNIKFVHIRTIRYGNNGFLRILALIQFSLRIFWLRNKFEKPDIIMHTAQIPFENFTYYLAKKLKSVYVAEILDLWPESFVAYGLISKRNPLLKLAYLTEKWVYARADKLIFSIEGGRDYIIEKGWDSEHGGPVNLDKVFYINNGVDLAEFDRNKEQFKITDPDLENENLFNVVYLGSIRLANNIKQLVDAAKLLQNNSDIRFLIYGDGGERSALEKYCNENDISNVLFKQKWIELKYVPYVLSKSSLNIINYMPTDILRYGGSQGKLFQYLASGKPICSNQKMGYCLIEKNNLGIAKSFNTAQEYADAILYISMLDRDAYNEISKRTRRTAKHFDYEVLTDKLVKVFA